jgi:chromosome partitioning protein
MLEMLVNPEMDFQKFKIQAGIKHQPMVHAIVMTHCGWNRQKPNNPDTSTRFLIEQALNVAQSYAAVISETDISKCFYLLDDFHSSGRKMANLSAGL